MRLYLGQDLLEFLSHALLSLEVSTLLVEVFLDLEQLLCALCQVKAMGVTLAELLCVV